MVLLFVGILLLSRAGTSFAFAPGVPAARRRTLPVSKRTNLGNEIKIEPTGEFKEIDISKEMALRDKLSDPSVDSVVKAAIFEEIKEHPGSYAPFLFLDIIAYIIYDNAGTVSEFLTWYSRLMVRCQVDIIMSRDLSLADTPEIFSMNVGELVHEGKVPVDGLELADFEKAYKEAQAWDRTTPRNYDRRWASPHSIDSFVNSKLHYLEEEKLSEVQTDMESLDPRSETWLTVLEKWAKT
jgi:hypothetical protein